MAALAEDLSLSASETAAVRQQLETLTADDLLRSSKRSVGFLRYIVEETLQGRGDELKERTIGVNVFGKSLTYDTNLDHVVRTAASELRKRLALYYGREEHREEIRIQLVPGSYVPHFVIPAAPEAEAVAPVEHAAVATETPVEKIEAKGAIATGRQASLLRGTRLLWVVAVVLVVLVAAVAAGRWMHRRSTPQEAFWAPFAAGASSVMIAVGDVPNGPPSVFPGTDVPALAPSNGRSPTVPYGDAVAMSRVSATLSAFGKDVLIRRESAISFDDLREQPAVLIGAFNNDWSLQLTRDLRFSLAMDPQQRVIYIRDREHPDSRAWSWSIDPHPGERDRYSHTQIQDYALISRILDSRTGHNVVIMGGLYAYGTQSASEFLFGDQLASLSRSMLADTTHKHLQIVLETLVTDGTPGPPHVVAIHAE